jgi:LSD1 subclass zinc finger protein
MKTAEVKLTCGGCGGTLLRGEIVCPSCGSELQYPEGLRSAVRCRVCGHMETSGGDFCSSCGAALRGGKKGKSGAGSRGGGRPAPPSRRIEPWMIVAGASLVVLVAVVLFLGLPGKAGPGSGVTSGPTPGAASFGQGSVDLAPLEQAVRDNPNDPTALLQLANGLHDAHQWNGAISTYREYLARVPANPDARVDLGICYFELGQQDPARQGEDFQKAIEEMETALKKSPKHQPAMFNLGVVNLQMGNLEASRQWFNRAVEVDSTSSLGQRAKQMVQEHTF